MKIIIRTKDGSIHDVYYPNNIGETVEALIDQAEIEADRIGGTFATIES